MRTSLSAILVGAIGCFATVARATTADGLIGYWPLNGNGADASLGGQTLTIYGGAGFAPGLFGQALDLHAIPSQYAGRPVDDAAFDFGPRDFTVQIWVRFNAVSRVQNFMEKFEGTDGPGWTLLLAGGDPVGEAHFWAIEGGAALYSQPLFYLYTGVWNHFAARRTGAQFDLFFNGTIVDTVFNSAPVTDTSFPLILGRRNVADGRDFPLDGRLDEAAIWNRALSSAEIAGLYNGGTGSPVLIPEPAGAVLGGVLAVALWSQRRKTSRRTKI